MFPCVSLRESVVIQDKSEPQDHEDHKENKDPQESEEQLATKD